MHKPDSTGTYRGRYPCPQCDSAETGTDTIATSGRWIEFACDNCGHVFRKSAAAVSSLSRRLSNLASAAVAYARREEA